MIKKYENVKKTFFWLKFRGYSPMKLLKSFLIVAHLVHNGKNGDTHKSLKF